MGLKRRLLAHPNGTEAYTLRWIGHRLTVINPDPAPFGLTPILGKRRDAKGANIPIKNVLNAMPRS